MRLLGNAKNNTYFIIAIMHFFRGKSLRSIRFIKVKFSMEEDVFEWLPERHEHNSHSRHKRKLEL